MNGLAREDVRADEVEAFVRTGCEAVGLDLDAAALARVTDMFAMNARIASLVMSFEIPEAEDPLAVTRIG